MADDGVPDKFKFVVRDFTNGEVSLEALVAARTPGVLAEAADTGGASEPAAQ